MTHPFMPLLIDPTLIIDRAFTEQLHPRGTGAVGGQFVAGGGGSAPAKKAAPAAKKRSYPKGSLAFDGKRGAGYGKPGGDAKVHSLQKALNRLGFTDGGGNKLKDDGKLGPRTTAAVKKAQRQLGLKPDGVVTPALLSQLSKAKSGKSLRPAAKKAMPAKKTAPPSKAFGKQVGGPAPKKRAAPVVVKRTDSDHA